MPKPGNAFLKLFFAISCWMASISIQAQDPVANFTANNTSGCGPLRVAFTDQSTGDSRFLELGFWKRTVVHPAKSYDHLFAARNIYSEIDSKKCFGH